MREYHCIFLALIVLYYISRRSPIVENYGSFYNTFPPYYTRRAFDMRRDGSYHYSDYPVHYRHRNI